MTDAMKEPLEVPPKVPPDWRDWINEFPTTKALAILCFVAWILTPLTLDVVGWLITNGTIAGKEKIDGVLGLVDRWLNALNWVTAAAVFGVVTKYATTKPEVIRAEGEVKAAQTVAEAKAAAIAAPVAIGRDVQHPEIVDAMEQGAQLAAESAARAARGHGDG